VESIQNVMARLEKQAEKARKTSSDKEKQPNKPGVEHDCPDCKDTGSLIHKVDEKLGNGQWIKKDVWRPCHCAETRKLRNRFKNALIPDEFKKARFDNYEVETDVQRTLFEAIKAYLSQIQKVITDKPDQNSIGFIAVYGESLIREMNPEDRHTFKQEHNSWGLGKTHLQMAAAKWIMNNVQVRDEIAPGQMSSFVRGCRVLCVSDVEFMEDLIQAKMNNDGTKH